MDQFDRAGEWLVVLPDHVASIVLADKLEPAPQRVHHPSGRPWLIGSWESADFRIGEAGTTKIATLGFSSAGPQRLAQLAARTQRVTDLDSLGTKLPGCFHLLATVDGATHAYGTLSGLRKLVYARAGDVTVAATRADVLAALTGADVDEERLLMRLLVAEAVLHTVNTPVWRGVQLVDEDSSITLHRTGRSTVTRRWTPPLDRLPRKPAAERLRQALGDAVQARVDSGLNVTCDLSGGLDSTSLSFLLAQTYDRPLTTLTQGAAAPGDDDPMWADLAAEKLPGIKRLMLTFADLPTHYEDVLDGVRLPGAGEEPFPGIEDRPIYRRIAALLGAEGSQAHLTGEGGDEVVQGGSAGVFDMFRTRPRVALAYLRGYRALYHWTWSDVARMAFDQRHPYPAWLAARAQRVTTHHLDDESSPLIQMPPWATADAVAAMRDLLADEARRARQHGHNWTAHHTIWGIRLCAGLARRTIPLYAAEGVRLTSPYMDDAVIEACMSAQAHERRTPWEYKPLLADAMRGIVPDQSLARTTKAEGSPLEHAGIRTNVAKLAALCEDSRLAAMGLIDADKLRAVCTTLQMRPFTPYAMSMTFSCERWLRDLETTTPVEAS
ncbi:asparagine synthase-related protein [Streptomyces sp. NPDC058773]|uniref:asparagine synthase-related protein n=1 Tax=Streptomyces sp. NPDC058773 TaxID=3346632 RepID=UPI00368788EA